MATTNKQIIAANMLENNITETVDTYQGWKRRGFQVRKGSTALFTTRIWKPCKFKPKDGDESADVSRKLILVNAAFFGLSQVDAIEKSERR